MSLPVPVSHPDNPRPLPMNLSDLFSPKTRWQGSYSQSGKSFAFTAEFTHDGNSIKGVIIDKDRIHNELTLDEYLDRSSLTPLEIRDYKQYMVEQFRCTDQEIIYVSESVTHRSTVQGEISDNFVSFVKTYQSGTETIFHTTRLRSVTRAAPHSVLYEGILSPDETTIIGNWFLKEKEGDTVHKGTFTMSRL